MASDPARRDLPLFSADTCRAASLLFLGCAMILRLSLPGMSVELGENALVVFFCCGALLFTSVSAFHEKDLYFPRPAIAIPVLAVAIIPLCSAAWAGDKISALGTSALWLSDVALFFCVCYWGKNRHFLAAAAAAILSCMAIEVFYALYQYWIALPGLHLWVAHHPQVAYEAGVDADSLPLLLRKLHSREVFGHFTLSNSLGGYLSMSIPIFILLGKHWKSRKTATAALAILCILALWAISLSKSRGSALCLVMVFSLWAMYRAWRVLPGKLLFFSSLGIFALALATLWMSRYTHRLDFVGEHGLSFVLRIAYWAAACGICRDHLFWGVGANNFQNHYYLHKISWAEEVDLLHNCYLQWLVEMGLLGLGALLLLVAALIHFLRQSHPTPDPGTPPDDKKLWWPFPLAAFLSCLLLSSIGYLWEVEPFRQFCKSRFGPSAAIETLAACLDCLAAPILAGIWSGCFYYFRRWGPHLPDATGIRLAVAVFALHSFLDVDFYAPALSQTAWLLLAIAVAGDRRLLHSCRPRQGVKTAILLGVCAFMMWMGIALVPRLLTASQNKRDLPLLLLEAQRAGSPREAMDRADTYRRELEQGLDLAPWEFTFIQAKSSLLLEEASIVAKRPHPQQRLAEIFDDLSRHSRRLARYHPHQANRYLFLSRTSSREAEIWRQAGNPERSENALSSAEAYIRTALALYPIKAEYWIAAGELAEKRGDQKSARDFYHRALYFDDMGVLLWKKLSPEDRKRILEKLAAER